MLLEFGYDSRRQTARAFWGQVDKRNQRRFVTHRQSRELQIGELPEISRQFRANSLNFTADQLVRMNLQSRLPNAPNQTTQYDWLARHGSMKQKREILEIAFPLLPC
jgi:hypothetical protein